MIEIINIGINSIKEIMNAVFDRLKNLGLGISDWAIIGVAILVIAIIIRITKKRR